MSRNNQVQSEPITLENPLNCRFGLIAVGSEISAGAARCLNRVHQALQGLSAISAILTASGAEEDCNEGRPLNASLSGGLLAALSALFDFSIGEIERLEARNNKAIEERSEFRHD